MSFCDKGHQLSRKLKIFISRLPDQCLTYLGNTGYFIDETSMATTIHQPITQTDFIVVKAEKPLHHYTPSTYIQSSTTSTRSSCVLPDSAVAFVVLPSLARRTAPVFATNSSNFNPSLTAYLGISVYAGGRPVFTPGWCGVVLVAP